MINLYKIAHDTEVREVINISCNIIYKFLKTYSCNCISIHSISVKPLIQVQTVTNQKSPDWLSGFVLSGVHCTLTCHVISV